jgi:hypothetical protein
VDNLVLGGKTVTLSDGGNGGASLVLNVLGKFVITGGGKVLVSGNLQPSDVLYNILGASSDVAFSGGGGGLTCCKAQVDGTLLALQRKIRLSPGLVHGGAVISEQDISIVSGSEVTCPLFCPKP